MAITILLGPPGAGKGTQTEKLVQHYNLVPVVPGCLMRDHIQQGTEVGKQIASYVNEGLLAPHNIVLDLVEESLKTAQAGSHFLFDGFPRAISQARLLDVLLNKYGYRIDAVVLMEVSDDIIRERIRKRARVVGRADDQSEEKIATRIEIYHHETSQVVAYYEGENKLYRISAIGTIPDVFNRITGVVDRFYKGNQLNPTYSV